MKKFHFFIFILFIVIIFSFVFWAKSISAGTSSAGVFNECHDNGSGWDERVAYSGWVTGQAYWVDWNILQNDDPSPIVEVCMVGPVWGPCRAFQDSKTPNMPQSWTWKAIGNGDTTPVRGIRVKVSCDGGYTNGNDFKGDFTVNGHWVEHLGVTANPTTVKQGESTSLVSFRGVYSTRAKVIDQDKGETAIGGGDQHGGSAYTYNYTYTPSTAIGAIGLRTVNTCVHGPGWSAYEIDDCYPVVINVQAGQPYVDIKCDGSDGPCTFGPSGGDSTLSWITAVPTKPSYIVACDASGAWSGAKNTTGGTEGVHVNAGETNTYTITCRNADGIEVSDSVTVGAFNPPPSATITSATANGTRITSTGQPVGTISGTATDDTSVNRVVVAIRRLPTAGCRDWNGTAFTITCFTFNAVLSGPANNRTWTFANTPPLAGLVAGTTYRLRVYAIDNNGGTSATTTRDVIFNNSPVLPTATNPTLTAPDYCSAGPSATLNWTYAPGTGTQIAYQVQFDNAPYDFVTPLLDTGTVNFSNPSYYALLQFDTSYRARVRVQDQANVWSAWSPSTAIYTTPRHAYPRPNFSVVPIQPRAGEPAQFTDTTIFAPGSINNSWLWNFGDGMGVSTLQNPQYTYATDGTWTVTLQATDDAGTCQATKNLNIQTRLPQWKEVAPR